MEEIKILKVDDTSFECQTLIQFSSLIKLLYKLNEKEKSLEQKIDIINQTINEKEIRIKNLEKKLEEQPKFDELKIGQSLNFSPNNTQNIINPENYESPQKDIIKPSYDFEYKKEKEKEKENERELNIGLNEVKNEEKEKSEIIKKEEKIEEKNDINIDEKKDEKIEEKPFKEEKPKKEEKEEKLEKKENIINLDFNKEEKKDSYEIDSPRNINPDLIKNLAKRSKEYEKRIMELIKKSNEHSEFFQNIKKNH